MRNASALILAALLASAPAAGATPSVAGAFFRSLLVPGWGQRASGRGCAGAWFLAAEAGLWGGYWGSRRLAAARADEYRTYAAVHAGARPAGKDDEFWADLGFYASVRDHNLYAAYRDGPNAVLYPLTSEFFWEWESQAARQEYRRLRNGSESARRQALYCAGAAAVNHVLAAVEAARGARAAGLARRRIGSGRPGLAAAFEGARGLARLSVVHSF